MADRRRIFPSFVSLRFPKRTNRKGCAREVQKRITLSPACITCIDNMYRLYYPRDMNFNGNDPVFLQLAHNMEHLIEAGAYPLDEPLPSVREIAFAEKINPGTVARAYSIMIDDGYVVSEKGIFHRQKRRAYR